jgi:hypothetical protein
MLHRASPTVLRPAAVIALLAVLAALAGCGESAQAKAKIQVCNARNDVAKRITTPQNLTLTASAGATAKASFEAIGRDVTQIKAEQGHLDATRRQQVEAATHNFVSQVNAIATSLSSSASLANAEAQFRAALAQLASAYSQTLGSINCL